MASAGNYLNEQHAFYGSAQNRVNSALDSAVTNETRLKTEISSVEDADMLRATTDLSNAILQHNAALAARGKAPKNSLFDYMA